MAQIDQFSSQQPTSINDFQTQDASLPPVSNPSSNTNLAAHTALLSPQPDQIGPVFNNTSDELNQTGDSQTMQTVVATQRNQTANALRSTTADLLTDPNAADEWKQAALAKVNDPQSSLYRVRAMVATNQASQPNPGESQETTDLRGVYAGAINQVLDFQRQKQVYMNEQQIQQSSDKAAGYVSMAEDMVPGVSGFKQSSLANDISGGGVLSKVWGTILPGEAQQAATDKFNSIPFDQRQAAMQKVMGIIAQHGTSILMPEESDQANLAAFRDTVDSGSYTATDRTIDNILGVLDTTGVLGFLKKAANLAHGIDDATDAAKAVSPDGPQPRSPTQPEDWRTGNTRQPGTFDQEGNPSSPVSQAPGNDVSAPLQTVHQPLAIEQQNWSRNMVTSDVQPTSPSQVVKDANPEMARRLHNAVETDPNGDVASAIYGTTREDAIAHDIMPSVGTVDGSVDSKVFHPEKDSDFAMMPDSEVLDFVDNSGAAWLSPAEKRVLRGNSSNDFLNATGMVSRKEMSSVTATDDGAKFSAVYGPTDSGWGSVKDAVNSAVFNLRDYGIDPSQVSVLARNGETYQPIPVSEALSRGDIGGDFLLKIDHDYKFNSADLPDDGWEHFDVKRNFADRWFPGGGNRGEGTIQSSILDPQSMLNPGFTKGATIGGLRGAQLEKRLMQTAKPYVTAIKGMSAEKKGAVFAKIREANAKGQEFNYANLKAEGFEADQIASLEHWKATQDTLYHIENRDLVKTMSTRGYGLIDHPDTGTRLIAKDLPRNQVKGGTNIFDPETNTVRPYTNEELAAHYENEGSVARTVSPMDLDGGHVEHVLLKNKPGSTYVRALRNTDQLLNYRKGYYSVRYLDPHFIEQRVKDANGKPLLDDAGQEVWKAVATASNVPDAKRAVERLTKTTGLEHRFRDNVKGEGFDRATAQSITAGGRSAQRVRGKRLEEAMGDNHVSEQANIESPIQSMLHSISSTSSRVGYRDWIETAKQRFVKQYADVLPRKDGMVQFPLQRSEIGIPGQLRSKMAGDARTTFEYIRMMENGYNNTIDDGWKAAMNGVADILGNAGAGKAEQVARGVGSVGPANTGRSLAFNLLLAANPVRQFLLQGHQVMMLGANFPHYVFTGQMVNDLTFMAMKAIDVTPSKALLAGSGRTAEDVDAMWNALEASGISAGISKHAMVRDSLKNIADAANASASGATATRLASKAIAPFSNAMNMMRKVGFDAGEWVSSSASFLAHYNEVAAKGGKMSQETIDDLTVRSRNYVYNMDKSGSIAWSHNSASILTQFMEQPYKAILQMTTNRGISGPQKFALATFMGLMYGTHAMSGLVPPLDNIIETYANDLLPDEPDARQMLLNGMEGWLLNNSFSKMYGQPVNLDYSSFYPLDSYGLFQFAQGLFTADIGKIVASTPAGSLMFGNAPRIATLAKTTAAMMGLGGNQYEADPARWSNLWKDAISLTSGGSNALKAAYALEYGRRVGALGGVQDTNVNSFEAIAAAIGLPTLDQTKAQHLADMLYTSKGQMQSDVKAVYDQVALHLTQDGITPDVWNYQVAMLQSAMSAFKGNTAALSYFQSLMQQQTDKNGKLMTNLLRQCGFIPKDELIKYVNNLPSITDAQRSNILDVCKTLNSSNQGNQ